MADKLAVGLVGRFLQTFQATKLLIVLHLRKFVGL